MQPRHGHSKGWAVELYDNVSEEPSDLIYDGNFGLDLINAATRSTTVQLKTISMDLVSLAAHF